MYLFLRTLRFSYGYASFMPIKNIIAYFLSSMLFACSLGLECDDRKFGFVLRYMQQNFVFFFKGMGGVLFCALPFNFVVELFHFHFGKGFEKLHIKHLRAFFITHAF